MGTERRIATVFGGSGFLGRYVVQRLARAGYIVRVAVRDTEAAKFLRPMGDVGQIVLLQAPVGLEAAASRAIEGAHIVINLTGILAERRAGDFDRIHAEGAERLARLATAAGAGHFVQVSAIGASADSLSAYARSKAAGEAGVRAGFPGAVILRPSIIFGAEDAFFNRFAAMACVMPVIPIVYGQAKFQPVYVADVADAVMAALRPQASGQIYELGGPEVKSFTALLAQMLALIGRHRRIISLPVKLARFQAFFLEKLPGKLLTNDQITLLAHDNVVQPGALGLDALGITPTRLDLVLPSYLRRYRPAGKGHETLYRE